ncbi:DUF262 domain-containing protein [Gillisia hiemivivida]|uniref:DUF262 domain-containing protein n=1 Tax=Gillisia hiemivivida TaxID=291190 RepID=A0A5C6ZWW2_9FLAO|nr:DUF262 domain-containing protein [Gillisia hiemivivida]TXD93777.1 DUF262 domain-containing protein [Gillisia hiemivivida]
MDNIFETKIVSLKTLDNYNFSIPTYQRPYVWGDEQLKKILDDFYLAFNTAPNDVYYVSTFLTKENNNEAELIDGQQRFTTLWLISFVLDSVCESSEISKFLKKDGKLRLSFEIRKEVGDFFRSLLEEENTSQRIFEEQYIIKHPYLKNIAKAFVFIKGFIDQLPVTELDDFGDWIYRNVHLIKNTTPKNTDLNKLFSTINSAGIQLEQTDIIKANLLSLIDEKTKYSRIWESCENMNNFFERNARDSFPSTKWEAVHMQDFTFFNDAVFKYQSENLRDKRNSEIFNIDNFNIDELEEYKRPEYKSLNEETRKSDEIYCRSVISFGQILLHTYRIHLYREKGLNDFEGTFHVSRLIEIFNELVLRKNPEEIKRFFLLLWDIRYLFDKYIIKWISDVDTKSESLELVNINRNKESYYSRSKYEKSESLMLQSVLYFTGDYLRQYWLTTYLNYLHKNHSNLSPTDEKHLNYLEKLDNTFSICKSITDKELSWSLMGQDFEIEKRFNIKEYLNSNQGTRFKHYWFQKLEYIIWKNWKFEETDEFKSYKITSKNSIEHIYPQNPENILNHPEIKDEYLHSFGNLVLLSVSQNSEYSNKSVSVKKSMFKEKRDAYDTLKSYYIFEKSAHPWNIDSIKEHQKEMIKKITKHYFNE